MNIAMLNKYVSLCLWIIMLISIGTIIGISTQTEVSSWYVHINRSPLTPPGFVFSIAWTFLYGMIGACGWMIWRAHSFHQLPQIKILFIFQLLFNWAWTPLFFKMHFIGIALLCLNLIIIMVMAIIYQCFRPLKKVSLFLLPYLMWLLFASYLNFYIWLNN